MPLDSRPDHVAIAVPDVDGALPRWQDTLGGSVQWRFHTPTVFRGAAVQYRNDAFLEMIMPSDAEERTRQAGGPAGFVTRFLDRFGAAVHHMTLKVPDIAAALATLEEEGFDTVDVHLDDPGWQEAFLRPSEVGGLVVQVAASNRTNQDWARMNGFDDVPPPPTDGARLLGPQLVHDDLDRARAVWATLGGTVQDTDDGLLVSWQGEPLTVAIRHGDDRHAVGVRFLDAVPRPGDPTLGPPVLATANA